MQVTRAASLCYDSLLALVYPQSCAVCGGSVEARALGVACTNCWRRTHIFKGNETLCWKCGLPSTGAAPVDSWEDVRCRRCEDLNFTAARACGIYELALKASVLSLKREPHISARVRELLITTQARHPLNQATLILPVPLHKTREKGRGFNQAAIIARALAMGTGLPLDLKSVIRTSHTERHRAGMDATDRRATVADAFQVVHPNHIAGEHVLLVDDVFTTGATVSSCASALFTAGAAQVFVLTLARPRRY